MLIYMNSIGSNPEIADVFSFFLNVLKLSFLSVFHIRKKPRGTSIINIHKGDYQNLFEELLVIFMLFSGVTYKCHRTY